MAEFPNLAGVITKDDVFKKGRADFVAWARIANYMNDKAPGWLFGMRATPEGGHVWKAPDGSGYILGYFTGPSGSDETPDFPYAIMDFKNAPIKAEKITSRDFTDAHRRGFCAAAAYFFSLGYELWAKEEVSDSAPEETPAPAPKASKATNTVSKQQPAATPSAEPTIPAGQEPIEPDELKEIGAAIKGLSLSDKKLFDKFCTGYRRAWKLASDAPIFPEITEKQHGMWCQKFLAEAGN